jgi:hypothetical protein
MGNKSKKDQQPAGVLDEHELRAFVHREVDGGRLRVRLRRFGMHKRAGRARRIRAYGCRSAGEADRLR